MAHHSRCRQQAGRSPVRGRAGVGFPQVVTQPELKQSEVLCRKLRELKIPSPHLPSRLRSQASLRALITKPTWEGGLEGCLVWVFFNYGHYAIG